MTDRYWEIYRTRAADYDRLVSAEDKDRALPRALAEHVPPSAEVVEVGVGTGRLTRLLLAAGCRVRGVEQAAPMLAIARERLDSAADGLVVGDAISLPFEDRSCDVAIEGWTLGHQRSWAPARWRENVDRALDELQRVVRPGGVMLLLETLGTGVTEPQVSEELAEVYAHWERERGFRRQVLRTDYAFASLEEAVELCGFFFGEAMAQGGVASASPVVPECTGLWSLRKGC